ncbi:MAG: hypothetical protein ACOY94_06155 [Bacillota bacterium]
MPAERKNQARDWQVTIKRVHDPAAVAEGERLLLEFALRALQKRLRSTHSNEFD